ncbi:GntR family transcriptional repressor for pyruvate dehydrogenase complex [Nitrobacteraceae bacterium AZCC 2146]
MAPERLLHTVSPNNLTDRITATLRDDIVSGKYAPGGQLPPGKELGQQFGVSITVVREALSRLKADGLVASRQGKGVFVPNDTKARPFRLALGSGTQLSLTDIFELRMGVEVQAASLAAERRTTRDLNLMARYLKVMEPARKPFAEALAADLAFHRAIAEATRNPLIVGFMEFLQPHLHEAIALARANSAKRPETENAAYKEHIDIYEAIAAKDARRARRSVRLVLDGSLKRLSGSAPS